MQMEHSDVQDVAGPTHHRCNPADRGVAVGYVPTQSAPFGPDCGYRRVESGSISRIMTHSARGSWHGPKQRQTQEGQCGSDSSSGRCGEAVRRRPTALLLAVSANRASTPSSLWPSSWRRCRPPGEHARLTPAPWQVVEPRCALLARYARRSAHSIVSGLSSHLPARQSHRVPIALWEAPAD